MNTKNLEEKMEYTVGVLSLIVVIYRICFIMVPILKLAIANRDTASIFKSFTLLV